MTSNSVSPARGQVDAQGFYRLSGWEMVTGWVGGFDPPPPLGAVPGKGPRQALEELLTEALVRSPCVIEFSGGRDSSALLCVAVHVARREGLAQPVVATHDFSGRGPADETDWQEKVVRHLGLQDWYRTRDLDVFDVLGPSAQEGLRRYGLLWPALAHRHAPFAELAAGGGSIVLGEGGDEVLGMQRLTRGLWYLSRRPLTKASLRRSAGELAPLPLRRALLERRRRAQGSLNPWLPAEVQDLSRRMVARDYAAEPLRWDRAVRWHLGSRAAGTAMHNVAAVLARSGVSLHAPLIDARFVDALAVQGGIWGMGSRTEMMRALFGDVVPDEICRRTSKAHFGAVAIGAASRAFLQGWDGAGVDAEVVDADELRRALLGELPAPGAFMLLQSAWLAGNRLPLTGNPARP